MKIEKIKQENSDTLILCMAGWSISPDFMRHLTLPSHADHWIVYDYRDFNFEESFSNYKHIHLIAWSLGVWVATYLWTGSSVFETTTAINGTPFPINDQRGIPKIIFEGTLQNMNEDGIRRFNRRMCGNKDIFKKYSEFSACPLEQAKEELEFLYKSITTTSLKFSEEEIFSFWDHAIIATEDKIFPTVNLLNCWQNHCRISEIQAPHLPFYHFELTDGLWKQSQKNS